MTTTTSSRTFSPRPQDIERRWYLVDADGAVLGRLASEVAKILRGKHKPIFAPHADTGDHVVVVNAGKVRLTGAKESEKFLYRHSGFPGGLRRIDYARLLSERPVLAVEKAVKGMLPKNRLGRQMATKLKVYEGGEHPHEAQKPTPLGLGEIPPWEGLPPAPAPKAQPKARREDAARRGRREEASAPGRRTGGRLARAASAARATGRAARARGGEASKAGGARAPRKAEAGGTRRTGRRARKTEES